MKKVIESIENKLARWNWEDTWQLLGWSILTTIAVGILYGLGMCMFFAGEIQGYYIETNSYYEKNANFKYVVLDSTTMKRNKIINFYVKANVSFTDDPTLLETQSAKEAQDLYFKLISQKMYQHFKTQSIAELFKDLPFDEKIEFLFQIKMLNVGNQK